MNFRIGTRELVGEEFTLWVSDELNKRHEDPPRMRTMAKNSFQEYFCDHFFERVILDLQEQIDKERAEPKGVVTWEA